MTDTVAETAARKAAAILAPDLGPNLPGEVEAVLYARRHGGQQPDQYDPLAIANLAVGAAGLIVMASQFAYSIRSDHLKQKAEPSPDSLDREVRSAMADHDEPMSAADDRVIQVVVAVTINLTSPDQ